LAAAPAQPVPQSAQPAKSSGGVAKIILVAAIAVVIGILAAGKLGFAGWRASQPGTANAKTNDALFSIPGIGSIATGSDATADPSQLGAPVYPGAVQDKGAVSVGLSAVAGAEAHFTTSDPVSQVVSFYTSNVTGAIVAATANGAVINAGPTAKDRVTVTITPGSGSNAGKTEIVIVRTAKS
jgi:hypothetical protein